MHLGGEMNCLAKLCIGIAICVKRFEKLTLENTVTFSNEFHTS